jgi:hypothetical protein
MISTGIHLKVTFSRRFLKNSGEIGSVKFFKTPKSADQGRDIGLEATEDISIFGFHLKNENNGRLYLFLI